jgi:uncharacterized protein YaiE (UPF0345 family)
MVTEQLTGASVASKANVFFDGKCVSHTVILAGGVRKSVGVILPSTLTFNTDAPERMEIVAGSCRYKLAGAADWKTVKAGESFDVPGKSSFQIEQTEPLHYVCHFG